MNNELKPRIGLFGGSFNPIHKGHLALAKTLCDKYGLHQLWFMVSPQNPLKKDETLLNDAKRLELVRLAIGEDKRLVACDFEFTLPRPSYTVHTLQALRQAYPAYEFILIIGADNWQLFPRWYRYEEILATTPIWVYPRPHYPITHTGLPAGVCLIEAPLYNYSSTDVRQLIKQDKDLSDWLPAAVWEAIQKEHLYTHP